MENKNNNDWHLVRTNNGEWISSNKVVYLDQLSEVVYKAQANLHGLSFSVHESSDAPKWCYKHELEAVKLAMGDNIKKEFRDLAISSANKNKPSKQ